MLSEVVNRPAPPSLVVGLFVGHVANQVGLPCDVHFNHNQQAAEIAKGLVSCEL